MSALYGCAIFTQSNKYPIIIKATFSKVLKFSQEFGLQKDPEGNTEMYYKNCKNTFKQCFYVWWSI